MMKHPDAAPLEMYAFLFSYNNPLRKPDSEHT